MYSASGPLAFDFKGERALVSDVFKSPRPLPSMLDTFRSRQSSRSTDLYVMYNALNSIREVSYNTVPLQLTVALEAL